MNDSLYYIQTPPLLILLRQSTWTKLHPSISSRLSSAEESRYVSVKYMTSCLCNEIYGSNCVGFEKLWTDKLLRFQWQTERQIFS